MSERKTILIVDDDEGLRTLMSERLENDNFNTVVAANGLHAFQILTSHKKEVDLMICDVNMPGLSGVQLVEKINEVKEIRPFPVIMLSANRNRDVIIRSAKTGVVEYLLKPFKYPEILEKIKKILQTDFVH